MAPNPENPKEIKSQKTYVVEATDPDWSCAAVAHNFLCAGLSSLRGHRQWESRQTPAL